MDKKMLSDFIHELDEMLAKYGDIAVFLEYDSAEEIPCLQYRTDEVGRQTTMIDRLAEPRILITQ